MDDQDFFDYLINQIDETINNVIKEQEEDVFPYYTEQGRWKTSYPEDEINQHANFRCSIPMSPADLWAPVFYIVCDYDEFIKEHRN